MRRTLPLLALLALAGCGGSDPAAPSRPAAELPFPPKAAEPGGAAAEAGDEGRVVRVGTGPEGIVFDPESGLVAVGTREPAELVLLDGQSGEERRRVRLPSAPRHLQLGGVGDDRVVLVPAEETDELVEVDLPAGGTRITKVGDQPHDAAQLGDRVYVGDEFGSTVTVVEDGRVVDTLPVDVQPGGVVATQDKIGLISVRAFTVELLDPATNELGGSQNAGYGPTHAVADDEGRLYITDTRGDALIVFETEPRLKAVARVPLAGSPYGIAIGDDQVWVTLTERNEVVEVSTGSQPKRGRTLKTIAQPNTVAVDPASGRLFIASREAGVVQLLDP